MTLWRRTEREEGWVVSVVPNTHFTQAELARAVAMHEAAVAGRLGARSPSGKKTLAAAPPPPPLFSDPAPTAAAAAIPSTTPSLVYAADLEARVRALDWKVQDEIYELLSDRVQSSSSAFRRREWRVVVLSEVPGGEMTDAPTGFFSAAGQHQKQQEQRRRRLQQEEGRPDERREVRALWRRGRRTAGRAPEMPVTEYRLILRGTETKANDQGWGSYNRYSRPWKLEDERELGERRRRWSAVTGRSEKYVDF